MCPWQGSSGSVVGLSEFPRATLPPNTGDIPALENLQMGVPQVHWLHWARRMREALITSIIFSQQWKQHKSFRKNENYGKNQLNSTTQKKGQLTFKVPFTNISVLFEWTCHEHWNFFSHFISKDNSVLSNNINTCYVWFELPFCIWCWAI